MNAREQTANVLVEKRHWLAEAVTRRFFERHPELRTRWGEIGVKRCTEDSAFHFSYLAEAIRFDFPVLFIDYLNWTKALMLSLGIGEEDLRQNLGLMKEAVDGLLTGEGLTIAVKLIDHGIAELPNLHSSSESHIKHDAPFADVAQEWLELLLKHRPREARQLVLQKVKEGASVTELYQHVFTVALYEVGRLWQTRQINEAEEHYCSQITSTMLSLLSMNFPPVRIGRAALGFAVGNETHEIGIRLVMDCLGQHGWDAVCLGSNVPTRNIPNMMRTWAPDIVAISVTMTYHLAEAQAAILAIKKSGVPKIPKILIGGRPFQLCPELGARMGADATGLSCPELVAKTAELIA